MMINDRDFPSSEARELSQKLRESSRGMATSFNFVEERQNLIEEFAPRSEKALRQFKPKIEQVRIDACECLLLTPSQQKTDDTILYFFGGGYVSGSPECDLALTVSLADKTGARIIMPRYPLAPENPFPAAIDCAEAVYIELLNTPVLRPTLISGESAGGGLALSLMQRIERTDCKMPRGLCLFSPWVDLSSNNAADDPSVSDITLASIANIYAPTSELKCDEAVSPGLWSFHSDFPPLFISTGTQDAFYLDLVAFASRLRNAGCDVDLHIWPELWHVFEVYFEIPEAELSISNAAQFMSSFLS